MKLIRNGLTLLVVIYGGALTSFLIARAIFGETTPIAIINRLLPTLLLPALILGPLTLLLHRVRIKLLLIPALWVLGSDHLPLFLPRPVPDIDGLQLTVATYNLGARTDQLEALFANMLALDADVIGLQEVSPEAAVYIADNLSEIYPHQSVRTRFKPYYGTGILSRYPLVSAHIYDYAPQRRRMQWAQLDLDGTPITVFNFHAQPVTESWRSPDVMIRRNQVKFLVDEALAINGPRILLGDFNFNEQSEDYGLVTFHFQDAWYAAGYGLGFTNPVWGNLVNPPISRELLALVPRHRRIDFVFYDDRFQATQATVWPDAGGSDHLPVVAALTFEAK